MPKPVNRTVLFDPGEMSADSLSRHNFVFLDDIVITHSHPDHFAIDPIKKLVSQFPDVRITSTQTVVDKLQKANISATTLPSEGIQIFESPHESGEPLFDTPVQIGIHLLDQFSHPGDSHSFTTTKSILALPIQAPWGSTVRAVNLALKLKPAHILPIHDWHYSETARQQAYTQLETIFSQKAIKFHKLVTAQPVVIN